MVALVNVVVADEVDAVALHVVVHHVALRNLDFLAQFGLFILFSSHKSKGRQAGAVFQINIKKSGIANDFGHRDADIFIKTSFPQFFEGFGDFLPGNFDLFAHLERKQSAVEAAGAGGGDTSDFVSLRVGIVNCHIGNAIVGSNDYLCVTCCCTDKYSNEER